MKLLLVLSVAVCFAGVYSDQEDPDKRDVLECAKESKMDMKVFDEPKGPDFVPTREMKCFSACVMKKKNMMDASGKYTENFKADKDLNACPAEYGSDDCETAGKLMACLSQRAVLEKVKNDVIGKSASN